LINLPLKTLMQEKKNHKFSKFDEHGDIIIGTVTCIHHNKFDFCLSLYE
jgi:hypothetical protein